MQHSGPPQGTVKVRKTLSSKKFESSSNKKFVARVLSFTESLSFAYSNTHVNKHGALGGFGPDQAPLDVDDRGRCRLRSCSR